jgi:hypothetical protein
VTGYGSSAGIPAAARDRIPGATFRFRAPSHSGAPARRAARRGLVPGGTLLYRGTRCESQSAYITALIYPSNNPLAFWNSRSGSPESDPRENNSATEPGVEGRDCGERRRTVSRVRVDLVRRGAGHQADPLSTGRPHVLQRSHSRIRRRWHDQADLCGRSIARRRTDLGRAMPVHRPVCGPLIISHGERVALIRSSTTTPSKRCGLEGYLT